ncbi:hypothetical protein G6F65_022490 [Rhizopus arrhizus]|nr:hypothetical protein G6F65_022490 [Rhizopus arrhizus]
MLDRVLSATPLRMASYVKPSTPINSTFSTAGLPGSGTGGVVGGASVSSSSSLPPQPANALVASNMAHHLLQFNACMLIFSFHEQGFTLRT